jgi:hypothetical protein
MTSLAKPEDLHGRASRTKRPCSLHYCFAFSYGKISSPDLYCGG